MVKRVKNVGARGESGDGARDNRSPNVPTVAPPSLRVTRTRISSKHQVTIGKPAFDEAGFKPGDFVSVRAVGPGRVELSNLDALLDRYRGSLSTGGELRRFVEQSRDEWP